MSAAEGRFKNRAVQNSRPGRRARGVSTINDDLDVVHVDEMFVDGRVVFYEAETADDAVELFRVLRLHGLVRADTTRTPGLIGELELDPDATFDDDELSSVLSSAVADLTGVSVRW